MPEAIWPWLTVMVAVELFRIRPLAGTVALGMTGTPPALLRVRVLPLITVPPV